MQYHALTALTGFDTAYP